MKVLLETDAVIIKKMKAMNEKNVLRNQRLDALEQANEALQARVLELEAKDAARMVPHVEH